VHTESFTFNHLTDTVISSDLQMTTSKTS